MIQETDIEAQMNHFARCGRCIEMLAKPHMLRPRRQIEPDNQWLDVDDTLASSALHPLLSGFVEWAMQSELESRLNLLRRRQRADRDHSDVEFRRLIHEVGPELHGHFLRYLALVRERDLGLIKNYENWRRSDTRHPQGWRADHQQHNENTEPLSPDEPLNQAAQRLADSVRLAIESGFYDDLIATEPQLAHFMSLVLELPENLAQALEFLNWLRQREPELTLSGSIPASEIEELALGFCEERGYSNGRSFSRETRRWLSGVGSERLLSRIARFLGLDRRPQLPNGRPVPHNPLDRYSTVPFHGLFLFLSSGDFPQFIETHWRDLHHLTGDNLDIYYSQNDLRDRTSGYEIVNQIRSLQLRVDALPALLLWEERIEAATTVPLQGLDYDEVVGVVKTVVQAIRDGCTLSQIAQCGATYAAELRSSMEQGVLVQSAATLLINKGGVMGDTYNVSGQAGAVGPGAHAHDITFNQIWNESGSKIDTKQLASELAQLRSALTKEASEPDHFVSLGEMAAAEKAATADDGPTALQHLKKAGSWVWDVGTKVGIGVAIAAAKTALGI